MTRLLRHSHVWLCLFFLYSCGVRETTCPNNHKVVSSVILKEIKIPLDGRQYNHDDLTIVSKNDSLFLFGFDRQNKTIDIINLDNKRFQKQIKLETEGVDQVIGATAFYVQSFDSIFLANDFNHIYLINDNGIKINHWDFNHPIPQIISDSFNLQGSFEFTCLAYAKKGVVNLPFYYNSQSNTFLMRFIISAGSLRNTNAIFEIYKTPVLVILSADTDSITNFYGQYPSAYNDESAPIDIYPNFIPCSKTNKYPIIQFQYHPEISINGGLKCSRSHFAKEDIQYFSRNQDLDSDGEMKAYNIDESYISLVRDKYRNQTYRIFQHQQESKDLSGLNNLKGQAEFSIMVLNDAGDILGEIKINKGIKADYFNILAHPDGILIPMESEFNEYNIEEQYEFILIQNPFS